MDRPAKNLVSIELSQKCFEWNFFIFLSVFAVNIANVAAEVEIVNHKNSIYGHNSLHRIDIVSIHERVIDIHVSISEKVPPIDYNCQATLLQQAISSTFEDGVLPCHCC